MKYQFTLLLQLAALMLIAAFASSCVATRPADREFHAVAEFAGSDDEATTEEVVDNRFRMELSDPEFEEIVFDRPLSKSYLQPPSGPYRVGPGDVLDIEVAEDKDTRTESTVMPDGTLYYNTAKGIYVKGKTIREISQQLSHLLKEDYVNPVVTVNVSKADSQRFWMLGQVAKPGTYPITKPTTLVDAISIGSGLLSQSNGSLNVTNPDSADLERATIIRDGEVLPVNFDALVREGDMSQNIYVKSGDYIFIPSLTARSIYVLGSVQRPGPVFYDRNVSMLSAVAAAGGTKPEAVVTKALIIRGGHLKPKVAVVNLRRIMKGYDSDLKLQSGDILWIPRSNWSNIVKYTNAVLNTSAQAVAVQEGLAAHGVVGGAGVVINAGAGN